MSTTLTSDDLAAYLRDWSAARTEREQQRRDPLGYISYAGFNKLTEAPAGVDGIPGQWSTGPDGPLVQLADAEQIFVDGRAVTGTHRFAPLREREFRRAAQVGDVIIELSKRGGQDLLRPIDPALGRTIIDAYDDTPSYEPDARWIVEGQFVPFDALRSTQVDATIGDIVHTHSAVGEVVFGIGGAEQRLLVFVGDGHRAGVAGTGNILFIDATSGVTTDPRGRSLSVEFPAETGPVTLDFNFTRNLQRPYTAFAPCPLPPAGNTVTVAIEAGEQLPVFTRRVP